MKAALFKGPTASGEEYLSIEEVPAPHLFPCESWRRGSESNRRMGLLQSPALPLGYLARKNVGSEGFEPPTNSV
jgi:hypothetical protein